MNNTIPFLQSSNYFACFNEYGNFKNVFVYFREESFTDEQISMQVPYLVSYSHCMQIRQNTITLFDKKDLIELPDFAIWADMTFKGFDVVNLEKPTSNFAFALIRHALLYPIDTDFIFGLLLMMRTSMVKDSVYAESIRMGIPSFTNLKNIEGSLPHCDWKKSLEVLCQLVQDIETSNKLAELELVESLQFGWEEDKSFDGLCASEKNDMWYVCHKATNKFFNLKYHHEWFTRTIIEELALRIREMGFTFDGYCSEAELQANMAIVIESA